MLHVDVFEVGSLNKPTISLNTICPSLLKSKKDWQPLQLATKGNLFFFKILKQSEMPFNKSGGQGHQLFCLSSRVCLPCEARNVKIRDEVV